MTTLTKMYAEALVQLLNDLQVMQERYDGMTFSQKREFERQKVIANQVEDIVRELAKDSETDIKQIIRNAGDNAYESFGNRVGLDNVSIDNDLLESLLEKPVAGKRLSQRLHKDSNRLAVRSTNAIRMGLIKGDSYDKIARRLSDLNEASFNNAMRIVRTESNRVSAEATQKGYQDAKELGINLKKKWVTAHDGRTRHTHAALDGQIVDIDDEFEIDGHKTMGPGLFGIASEDINCRCTTVEVFVDELVEKVRDKKAQVNDLFNDSISSKLDNEQLAMYEKLLSGAPADIQSLFRKYKNDINLGSVDIDGKSVYSTKEKLVRLNLKKDLKGNEGENPGGVFFHEFAHNIDDLSSNMSQGFGFEGVKTSLREQMDWEWRTYFNDRQKELKKQYKELGLRGFAERNNVSWIGLTSKKSLNNKDAEWVVLKALGDEYSLLERADISDWLEYSTGRSSPLGAGHGVAYHRSGDMTSKEIFAEITSAYVTNPDSLKMMQKIFPKTLNAYGELIKVLIK